MAPQILAGKYELQNEIARGGMGVIYKAFHSRLNDTVAIKLIHAHLSQDPSFAERFLREARAMGRLRQHEHIVKIYDADEEHGTHFLVMEFCPGQNLRTIIKQQAPLHQRHVVQLAEQVASALAYAHAQGVIHRDIKPANVLVDARYKAKLTDFGIAAARGEVALTSADGVIGTAEYMSPEQARGLTLDGRSDLYSLGVVMYEMLTGRTPYGTSTGTSILVKLASDRTELDLPFPDPIHSMVQGVVRDLLRRNPDDRIADADSLASQLHQISYLLPPSPPPTTPSDDSAHTVMVPVPPPSDHPKTEHTMISPPPPLIRQESHPARKASAEFTRPQQHPVYLDAHAETVLNTKEELERARQKQPTPVQKTPSSALPRGVLLAGGVILIGIISIIMMSSDGSKQDGKKSEQSQEQEKVRPPDGGLERERQRLERITEQLKEYESAMAQLEPIVRNTAAQLDASPSSADCPNLKGILLETYDKYDHTVLEMNRLRKELAQEPVTPIHLPALDRDCPVAKTPVPTPPPPHPPLPPKPSPDKVSPEAQLQSLLTKFTKAYEHRDLKQLRSLSHMSDSRLVNLETMFHNYNAFTVSVDQIQRNEDGAVVVLMIDRAITSTGEAVDLSPIAKKLTLRIARQGDSWDKIVW